MATHNIKLDIKKRTDLIMPRVVVRVGDVDTQIITAEITQNGLSYTSPLSSVRLDVLHADGTWARVSASKSGNMVTCTLPDKAIASAGECRLAHFVFFSSDGKAESTNGFALVILPNVDTSGATEEAKNYDDILSKLWEKWESQRKVAEANEVARVEAEKARATKDEARTNQIKAISDRVDSGIASLNEIANTAKASAVKAEAAASDAKTAISNVKQVTDAAKLATEKATSAATETANVTKKAEAAATRATDAAARVETLLSSDASLFLAAHPIGSYFMADANKISNPSRFGGTWKRVDVAGIPVWERTA